MVPAVFVLLDALPLTPNGKLDRNALPVPGAETVAHQLYLPPEGDIEQTLALIWQDLLHLQRIGRNDNFFELGGQSLLAVHMAMRIRERFRCEITLDSLFSHQRLAELAQHINALQEATLIASAHFTTRDPSREHGML
jgi:acyl carrier protein